MKRALVILTLVAAGCSSEATEVPIRAFEQPTAVTFVCYQINGSGVRVRALEDCPSPSPDDDLFLHALVIEESRGEIAAVNTEGARVLDSDPRVPGFTFVPVGEIPVAIAVPRIDPSRTYVADFGTHDIHVVDTTRFHPSSSGSVAAEVIPLPAAPTSLVIGPDQTLTPEGAHYVTLPDLGAIARVARAGDATPEVFTLAADVPEPVPAAPEVPYCKVCPSDREGDAVVPCRQMLDPYPMAGGISQPFPPREPVARGMLPAPVHAVVDETNNRLLVADRLLPLIHVVDLAAPEIPQPPIVVGVPTTEIVLTPQVPSIVDGGDLERFIYAIDAIDGSVLAVRYDEITPSLSAVLPVSVRGKADRISLAAPARALAVLAPRFPGPLCTAPSEDQAPLRLRGVFLAAALLDGTVAIVDVHDLDATCRGGIGCDEPPVAEDRQVFIRRHRPRIGALVTNAISLATAPTVSTNGVTFPIENDGRTEGELSPNLLLLEGRCPLGMTRVFPFGPDVEAALLCVLADPWAAESESWVASWEGTIPGTQGGRARLGRAGDPPEVAIEIPACARGVLGRENLASAPFGGPEAPYQPDLFVLTGELPRSTEQDEACRSTFLDIEGNLLPVDFPIERVERVVRSDGEVEHRLTIAAETRGGTPLSEVRRCFAELASYEIRAQGAYTVVGSRTGYRHRVVTDEASGLCVVDASLSEDLVGKARPGQIYDNGIVRFRLEDTGLTRGDSATLSFQIAQTPTELRIAIADQLPTLLSDVAFNPTDGNMYVVDTAFAGLVQVPLSPVRLGTSWE